jgi:hypothetical protein
MIRERVLLVLRGLAGGITVVHRPGPSRALLAVTTVVVASVCGLEHGAAHAATAAPSATKFASTFARHCEGTPVSSLSEREDTVETIAFDISTSSRSGSLRRLYALAAQTIIVRAAKEHATLRIVAFGSSGVGARVLFQQSFAPTSADAVFNLAAENRNKCLARQAIKRATTLARDPLGSDVAGTIASEIRATRSLMKPGGHATITTLSDGCEAPASTGPNRGLTDLCRALMHGKSMTWILRKHPQEFLLPSASTLTLAMRGVGVTRNAAAANTILAERLVTFWTRVCRTAHARACDIRSAVL